MRSVVSGHWQLILHQKYGEQLYDWKADPGELRDLIHTPEGQKASAGMREGR